MSLLPRHAESLDRFADTDATGWGVRRVLDLVLADAPGLRLGDVRVGAPAWEPLQDGTSWRWVAHLVCVLEVVGDPQPVELRVRVPWVVDDAATVSPPAGITLGGHRGTFLGRPRIPVASLVRRPGVRLLARRLGGATTVALELQPRFGAAWRVTVGPTTAQVRSDLVRLGTKEATFGDDRLDSLVTLVTASGFVIDSPTLDTTVAAAAGTARLDAGSDRLTPRDMAQLVAAARAATARLRRDPDELPTGVLGELDPAARELSYYGDQLLAAAYRAARGAVHATASSARPTGRDAATACATLIRRRVGRGLEQVASGGSTSVAAERLGNTVALAEAERQVSLIGPDGLPVLRGRLDLRTLDEQWRGILCPVHTPESTKVGLVRHVALGEHPLRPDGAEAAAGPPGAMVGAHDYADLSVAASLVPFLNHDDPTRASIVTKMFGQAQQVEGAHPPAVRTGMETALAEAFGAVRARNYGRVRLVDVGTLRVADALVRYGPSGAGVRDQDAAWRVVVGEEPSTAFVGPAELLAHAPDVVVEADGTACLTLGLDALTAFVPWHGWNYEDGIVVSSAFAQRAASHHIRTLTTPLPPYADLQETVPADRYCDPLPAGTALAVVLPLGDAAGRPVVLDEAAVLVLGGDEYWDYTTVEDSVATIRVRVRRPLQVGDKLTTRHGGKGVVTRIEPVEAMPRLPDGTPVEILLNPLGVLRRLNLGTYLEAATALERRLAGRTEPVVVPRQLGRERLADLAERLKMLGAEGGRLPLATADGTAVGPAEGVVVGDLHLMKLVHRAEVKASGSRDAGPSPVTLQPTRSRTGRGGAPQRLGEMELWALQAIGARTTLHDLLRVRGVGRKELRGLEICPAGLRAAMAHLAVAGIQVGAETEQGPVPLWRRPATPVGTITAVTVGTGASGLRDIVELMPTSSASPRRAAQAMLTAALAEPDEPEAAGTTALPADAARALGEETVRFTIPLGVQIEHPWAFRTGTRAPWQRPPHIDEVPILPAAFFLRAADADHDLLRRRYLDLLTSVVALDRAREDAKARETAVELAATAADRAATEAADKAAKASAVRFAEAQERVETQVRALLGKVGHRPADGTIAGRLSGKYGILRRNLLGASAIRSARGVLVGDPTLGVEQVGLPRRLLEELGVPTRPTGYADVVVLNRQPTLHPYNVVALRAVPSPNDGVTIHPYVLQAIAGDFDGDTAAVHRPFGDEARAEIWGLCRPGATLHHARDGKPLAKRDLDIAVGLHVLEDEDTAGLGATLGRPMPGGNDVSTRLTALVQEVLATEGLVEERLKGIADVMRAGWAGADRWGFSLLDLPLLTPADGEAPEETVLRVLTDAQSGPLHRLRQAFDAGAAGSATDLAQLLVRRGFVRTATALPNPGATTSVPECYLEGLGTDGYFAASQPAVAGLAAKKLVTPHAGGLTKRLVELGYDAVLTDADCGWTAPLDGAATRSPLTCRHPDPCRACYDPTHLTRSTPPDGARVGVLAGMLVGERSTQLAMKSIHQRGSAGDLKGDVRHLERVFGRRPIADADGHHQPWTLEAAAERFAELLPAPAFLPVHAQVLLRRAALTEDDAPRRPLTDAARRGDLAPLVAAVSADGRPAAPEELAGNHLLRLILGVPT